LLLIKIKNPEGKKALLEKLKGLGKTIKNDEEVDILIVGSNEGKDITVEFRMTFDDNEELMHILDYLNKLVSGE
jgi:hypothetical protein